MTKHFSADLGTYIELPSASGDTATYSETSLFEALHNCGAAYVGGKDIDWTLLGQMIEVCAQLHDLSGPTKSQFDVSLSPGARGFFRAEDIVQNTVDNQDHPSPVQKRAYESFEFGKESRQPTSEEEKILFAHNVWPLGGEALFLAGRYVSLMVTLGEQLGVILARILGLSSTFFADRMRDPFYHIRLMSYDPDEIERAPMLGAHTDYECFTLILESCGGLEVLNRNGEWLAVPPKPDKLIMLAGDFLELISEGRIESALHRVKPQKMRRLSCIYFQGLDLSTELAGNPSVNVSKLRVGDHLLARAIENYPHIRSEADRGEVGIPAGTGCGNPFKRVKIGRVAK